MKRAIITCMHAYTPFGTEYYIPILDFFLQTMKKYSEEYDMLYIIEDSNWEINPEKIKDLKATIIKVNPSLRYYDAYKEILPQVKEDLVLLLDNDFVIYKKGIIKKTFALLDIQDLSVDYEQEVEQHGKDVVSIIDQIGEYKTDKLKNGNKFCLYWFATRKDLLMKYRNVDWGSNMPEYETLGLLTQKMLENGIEPYEFPEDKNSIYFDGTQDEESGKNTGVYHIRAGSTPAVLLAWKENDPDQYWKYLKEQPKSEYLRQIMWFWFMTTETGNMEVGRKITEVLDDIKVTPNEWTEYYKRFEKYHGL